jgi:hypothetical protein
MLRHQMLIQCLCEFHEILKAPLLGCLSVHRLLVGGSDRPLERDNDGLWQLAIGEECFQVSLTCEVVCDLVDRVVKL